MGLGGGLCGLIAASQHTVDPTTTIWVGNLTVDGRLEAIPDRSVLKPALPSDMVETHASDLRNCQTSPSCSRPPPRPVIILDLTPQEIGPVGLTTVIRVSDMHLQQTPNQCSSGRGAAVSLIQQRGDGVHMRNSFVVGAGGPIPRPKHSACRTRRGMRAGGSETLWQGAKQCPDPRLVPSSPVQSQSDGQRGASEARTERPPKSCRRRRPHMIRTLHAHGGQQRGGHRTGSFDPDRRPKFARTHTCRILSSAIWRAGPFRTKQICCRHVPTPERVREGWCLSLPASRSPSLAGGEAMQDRAQGVGAVGLGETDEFGPASRGAERRSGHTGSQSFFLWQHGSNFIKTCGVDWRSAPNEIRGK